MKRPRLHIIVAFLVLFLSLGEWVHSQFRGNAITFGRPSGRSTQIIGAASECGEIIFYGDQAPPNSGASFATYSQVADKSKFTDPESFWQKIGFGFHANAAGGWKCMMPWWLVSLIAALSLLNTSFRQRRAMLKNRLAYGACVKCGYDLRGTRPPDRCPECGTAVPKSRTQTAPA